MATGEDLVKQLQRRIAENILENNREAQRIFITTRKSVLESVRSLWDSAAATSPALDEATGNVRYVIKSEAFKYGRFEKLNEQLNRELASGRRKNIRALEKAMVEAYNTQYNGSAWVYNQAYGLPVISGARVRLVAEAVYSDFYGAQFDKFLDKHWTAYKDDILGEVRRGLNQGHSYSKIAKSIQPITDDTYAKALRVARTEAGRVQSIADLDSIDLLTQLGADVKKEWLKQANGPGRKNREDHWVMDGKQANDKGIFTLPSGAQGPAPRLTGSGSEDINCLCSMIKVINGERPAERRIDSETLIPFDEFERGSRVNVTDVRSEKP